jgi:hypothetical protein
MSEPKYLRQIGLFDVVMIMFGMVIGSRYAIPYELFY